MNLAIFGLTISSSWGNGHAALWRGLVAALLRGGHRVTFFERDTEWYSKHRDLWELPEPGRLVLYSDWDSVRRLARTTLAQSDAVIVTSYCDDGPAASQLAGEAGRPLRCFYDLDTPITLARLARGEAVEYFPPGGLGQFDLVLSYVGGAVLNILRDRCGARRVAPLYGSVDPAQHRPVPSDPGYEALLSYLGTYAADRQPALERMFVRVARSRPDDKFIIGGALYPQDFPWAPNIFFVRHLPPSEHPAFYSSATLTLNVTRAEMARMGWCPSGRLFEAAACGTPIVSDSWRGIEAFFEPGREILIARSTEDVLQAVDLPRSELRAIARRARERVLSEHTADHRAQELIATLETARARSASATQAAVF